jgi:Tol biopolymer transport system component
MKQTVALVLSILFTAVSFADDLGWIVFDSNRDGNWNIWKMRDDGTQQTRLTTSLDVDDEPAFSPFGDKIAYIHRVPNQPYQVWIMNADGSGAHQVTSEAIGMHGMPNWSPDGTRIAYCAYTEPFPNGNHDICVINVDGSNRIRLTTDAGADEYPCFSPDGTRIAFTSDRNGGNWEIFVMDADGSNQNRLTNHVGLDEDPAWSHNGTRIAFASENSGLRGIWVMNADGSNLVQLTFPSNGYEDLKPAWNHDDSKIAFESSRSASGWDIFSMLADGSNVVRLTFDQEGDHHPSMPWRSPFAIAPDFLNVQPGGVLAGGLFEITESDDSYLYIRPGVTLTSQQPPVQVIVESVAAVANPSQLRFAVESAGSVGGVLRQRVWLYDFDADSYELVRTDTLAANDTEYTVATTALPSRFVSVSGRLRSKVDYKAVGPILVYPWFIRLDRTQWLVYP